jgi:hypothetical protein
MSARVRRLVTLAGSVLPLGLSAMVLVIDGAKRW